MMPLMLHLQQPLRGIYVMMTPHFTSAIAAFGIVFTTYGLIVASEIWFVYRQFIVETVLNYGPSSREQPSNRYSCPVFAALHGTMDLSRRRFTRMNGGWILAGIGIPVACFLHAMPVSSSARQGECSLDDASHAGHLHLFGGRFRYRLCIVTYIVTMEIRKLILAWKRKKNPRLPSTEDLKSAEILTVTMTAKYLVMFLSWP